MRRLAVIMTICLCALVALPAAFAGETKQPAAAKPAAPAMKYKEAPVLAALVKAGKLPAVEKRLPDNPLVVPADEIGQYGGVWRRGFLGPSDFNGVNRIVYDVLARFGPDGATMEVKLGRASPRRRITGPGPSSCARGRSGRTARPSPPTTSCTGTRTFSRTRISCRPSRAGC